MLRDLNNSANEILTIGEIYPDNNPTVGVWRSPYGVAFRRELLPVHYTLDWVERLAIAAGRLGLQTVGSGQPTLPKTKSLNWVGPFYDISGYGTEGRLLIDWLPEEVQAHLEPIAWGSVQFRPSIGETQRLKQLLSTEPTGLTVQHCFPTMFNRREGYNIGRTMYETDQLTPDWIEGLSKVDELWVPSSFCQEVFSQYHDNVHVIHSPIAETFKPLTPYIKDETCRFLFVSEWIKRKGIKELLAAFEAAFTDEPVELVLKTFSSMGKTAIQIKAEIEGVLTKPYRLYTTYFTDYEMAKLYSTCHCLVHPAKGEGFGRTVAEALACGIEAISIGETGLKEIQRYPLTSTRVPIPAEDLDEMPYSTREHHWYQPDFDELVDQLRESYTRWTEDNLRTDQDWIQQFSGPAVSDQIRSRIL